MRKIFFLFLFIIYTIVSIGVSHDDTDYTETIPPHFYYADRICEIMNASGCAYHEIPTIWRLFVDSVHLKVGWEGRRRYAWLNEQERMELADLIINAVDWESAVVEEGLYFNLYHFIDYQPNSYLNLRIIPYIRRNTTNKRILSLLDKKSEPEEDNIIRRLIQKVLPECKNYEAYYRKIQRDLKGIFPIVLIGTYETYLSDIGIDSIVIDYYIRKKPHDKRGWDFLWYRHGGDGEWLGLNVIRIVQTCNFIEYPYARQLVKLAQNPKNRYHVIGPARALKSLDKREWDLWDKTSPSWEYLTNEQRKQLAQLMIEAADWEYETAQDFWKSPAYYSFAHEDINSYFNLMILPYIRKYTDQKEIFNLTKTKYFKLSKFKDVDLGNNEFSFLISLLLKVMLTNCDYEFNLREMENRYEHNVQDKCIDVIARDRFADMGVKGKHISYLHDCNILQFIVDYYINYHPNDKRAWDFLWHFSKISEPDQLKVLIYKNNLQNNNFAKQILELLKNPENRTCGKQLSQKREEHIKVTA